MLQKLEQDRLDKVLSIIEKAQIRFPIAQLAKEFGVDQGSISKYLKGKLPMTDKFYSSFLEKYNPPKPASIKIKDADLGKELSRLIEITINQQAQINVLLSALGKVSDDSIRKESDRLFDEYLKRL